MIRDTSSTDRIVESPSPASIRTRRIVALLAALAATGLIILMINRWAHALPGVAADSLRMATVTRGTLQRDLTVNGRIVAAVRPTVYAPSAGTVTLEVRAGDPVTAGQLIAVVDSPELTNQLEQNQATLESLQAAVQRYEIDLRQQLLADQREVDQARVALSAAERELERSEKSWQKHLISEIDYRKASDDLETAKLTHEHAVKHAGLAREALQFELDQRRLEVRRQQSVVNELERRIAELKVLSPVDGMVGDLDVDNRQSVLQNQELLSVVDLSAMEVEVDVPESYADDLGIGTPAAVRVGSIEHPGQVVSVSPEIRDGLVSATVRFESERPDGLRQNQRIGARLMFEQRENVLKVQRGPFIDSGNGRIAYVREGDELHRRSITTRPGSLSEVEIVDGLPEGSQIVISDLARFDDAERIALN